MHKCRKIPEDYMLISKQGRWYLLNNPVGGITGTRIDGVLPMFYCPWCGEKLR